MDTVFDACFEVTIYCDRNPELLVEILEFFQLGNWILTLVAAHLSGVDLSYFVRVQIVTYFLVLFKLFIRIESSTTEAKILSTIFIRHPQ